MQGDDSRNEPQVRCHGCGKLYTEFPLDVVLTKKEWALISGREDEGGLLCADCILRKACKLPGVTHVKLRLGYARRSREQD